MVMVEDGNRLRLKGLTSEVVTVTLKIKIVWIINTNIIDELMELSMLSNGGVSIRLLSHSILKIFNVVEPYA